MALQLQLTNDKGVITNYHRIIATTQIYYGTDKGIHINLASYANADYREVEKAHDFDGKDGDKCLINTHIFLPFIDSDFSLPTLYSRIKVEVDGFAIATDI